MVETIGARPVFVVAGVACGSTVRANREAGDVALLTGNWDSFASSVAEAKVDRADVSPPGELGTERPLLELPGTTDRCRVSIDRRQRVVMFAVVVVVFADSR